MPQRIPIASPPALPAPSARPRSRAGVLAASLVASLVLAAGGAAAHHGWGSYDAAKGFTMTGPIKMVDWSNPHVHVMVDHDGATWEATLAPLFRMEARGLSADMLKAGATVSIEGYPSTRTRNEMRAERITIAGRTFELR